MLTPSPEIITLLSTFADAMTAPTFANALVLILGTILTSGPRTVTAALRVMGYTEEETFGKYHRVFNRAKWSLWVTGRLLLYRLIDAFVPSDAAIVLLIDETLERRQGRKIVYKGVFRDSVRSTARRIVTSLGIRWCCVCLRVSVPWSRRFWALPFLIVPVLSEKTCERLKKPHRSGVEWSILLIRKIRVWLPDREIVLIGDGGYAAIGLIRTCQRLKVTLVARLRIDAKVYDFPEPQPSNKRGPKPKKGKRQASFTERLADPKTKWETVTVRWYQGEEKQLEVATDISLWHQTKNLPVSIRWVLLRYEEENERTKKKTIKTGVLFCSRTSATAVEIVEAFVSRWNIEVMFEEIRAHLGFETQRQWSKRAMGRMTPCLFGVFSLVVLIAKTLHPEGIPVQQSAWYDKNEATFSDVLAAVRLDLWSGMKYDDSSSSVDTCVIPRVLWNHVQRIVCHAA